MTSTETSLDRAARRANIERWRETAAFCLRLGHRDMDGISAENLARNLAEAVAEIDRLTSEIESESST